MDISCSRTFTGIWRPENMLQTGISIRLSGETGSKSDPDSRPNGYQAELWPKMQSVNIYGIREQAPSILRKSGKPYIAGNPGGNLKISYSHKDDFAVAIVSEKRDVGIDMEKIENRSDEFLKTAFHESELNHLPGNNSMAEWITRLWTAKEAYGKSIGVGLKGNPRQYRVKTVLDNNTLRIEDRLIHTRRFKGYIIAWTSNYS